ncbi:MAG: hypothetical protein HKN48_05840 [Flavobacteriaceae bacterium]|nr:hypothetical protein [Flavobacteriaceae bacterium]
MKRLLLLTAFLFAINSFAQGQYTVDGQTYTLKLETEGELTLLWNIIDGEYRYFTKKGDKIVELKNSQLNGKYQEEYKDVLRLLTADNPVPVEKVKLTKVSLRKFHETYNLQVDPNYAGTAEVVKLKTRLGVFAGMTNYVYFVNPQNTLLPQAGVDFELIDDVKLKRHSVVFQFRQIFSSTDHDISSSQLSVNYRFKFVKSDAVDIFVNTKISDYAYLKSNIPDPDNDGNTDDSFSGSGGEFQAPFAFGIGADIAMKNGYITLGLYDILALNLEDNGDFSTDFVIGYKFNL